MAKHTRSGGWSGLFLVFTVLCAMALLLTRQEQSLTGGRQVLNLYEGLTAWSTPALFMIWGMNALEGGKANLKGTVTGLVLPCFCLLVFWGALYAAAAHLLGGGSLSWSGIWAALKAAARGETYVHLKLLYPLLGLYLVHPVLHRFVSTASRGEVRYVLALCLLFACVLPVWSRFYPDSAAVGLMQRMQVQLVLGYVGYYVAGWYLNHYTIGRIPEFILYILGALGVILTLFGDRLLGGGRALWCGDTAPGVALTAAALCTMFRYVLGISEERSRRRTVHQLGSYVFGAYLFHQIWALVFRWFGISVLSVPAAVSVPLFTAVFFLLSVPFAWLLSRIPVVGSWLTAP